MASGKKSGKSGGDGKQHLHDLVKSKLDKAKKEAQQKAEKAAAELKAAAEKAAALKAAAEKAAAEKAAQLKAAAEKVAAEKAAAEKVLAEKAAQLKAAAEKVAAEKAAAEKVLAEKAAALKAAAEKAAAEKAAELKAAAEKLAAEKLAAEKAAAEKLLADKLALVDKVVGDTVDTVKDVVKGVVGSLVGNGSANKLVGTDGIDHIFGEGGKDKIVGGLSGDILHGGGGDDDMSGDAGDDLMFGASTIGGKVDLTKMKVTEDTVAKVTFDSESAGYKNALGVYKIGPDGKITGVQILFANASLKGSGGDLVSGASSKDIALKAGETLGFFVVPDGYSQKGMDKLLSDATGSFKFVNANGEDGNIFNGSPLKLVHIGANGKQTVVQSTYGTQVFHSVDNGSLGLNGDKLNHAVGTVNNLDGKVQIGFEDLKNGGDKDYDDSVFTVELGVTNSSLLAKLQTKLSTSTDKDVMVGGEGSDKMFGMADNDQMDGGDGNDQMWGNSGNDTMLGGAGDDKIAGGKGDDVIADGAGNDVVDGNSGNDTFVAGEGDDVYNGGSGFDTIDYSDAKSAVSVDLNGHTASGMGSDKLTGIEAVVGSAYDDVLVGDKNDNTFFGGDGDDTFRGRGGADTFTGGEGQDTYVWLKKDVGSGVDHITDFAQGDVLNLKDLLKGQKYANIDEVVKFVGGPNGTTVSVNVDGHYVDVVTLDGYQGSSAAELLKAGMILA